MKFEPGQYYTIQFDEKNLIGIPLKTIISVFPEGEITPFPKKVAGFMGMANLAGKVVPIQNAISVHGYKMNTEEESYIILIKTYLGEVGLLIPRKFNITLVSKEQIDEALENYDEENYKNLLPIKIEGKKLILLNPNIPFKANEINNQISQFLRNKFLNL
ncbi:MAG: hypothetical protein DRQ88_06580 [Epsilonproteobacteria bacterium]|nr:MAG: hypothetical protein DRQ89_04710 [Campylobacterota bacterium]RLA66463.1 MAG: hypothetical protein DRQ88_06580 [Campylobacterota bacterium]